MFAGVDVEGEDVDNVGPGSDIQLQIICQSSYEKYYE